MRSMPTHKDPKEPDQASAAFFAGYKPAAEVWDELCSSESGFRDHWKQFLQSADRLGRFEIARRWQQARRLVNENGIAFGAYGDSLNAARPWEFDALPLLIAREEWEHLSRGLQQRAQLLELTLQDLYGPQKLLREKILPPEIVYRNPGFFTALHGIRPSLDRHMHWYAADLGRTSKGNWWLLGDRCEAPSGSGYALENRVVCSRMFPEAFRACNVFRLAHYFETLKETCRTIAPRHRDNPRIVLLSQGPEHENYFEDAYLSRYLGYTLVEGADLVVRDRTVWWKTLGGLFQVDVILRRPNTRDCDSLEIETHSPCAIPGLFDAVRAGNVAISNPLGSGLVESPIFMAFISPLCKALLGEEPLLPNVATWWCGQDSARKYVLENLDRLEIKRAFRQRGSERIATRELQSLSHEQLQERIEKTPYMYVGQERFARSSMPNWGGGNMTSANIALRTFLHTAGDSFTVLPGGLTRAAGSTDSLELSLADGEGSKDTWIQGADGTPAITTVHSPNEVIALRRSGDDLPSRVADDIYWTGRHIQRADFAARMLRSLADVLGSLEIEQGCPEIPVLLRTMADQGQIEPGFVVDGMRDQLPRIEDALPAAAFDTSSPNSLRSILGMAYRTASRIRDRLSADSWRVLSRIDETFRLPASGNVDTTDLLNLSSELIVNLASFGGLIAESMTRSQAFHFMDLGIRIERATQTSALLSNAFERRDISSEVLDTLLRVCDSRMTYRYRYLSTVSVVPVLDLLVTDDTNPRSIIYQLLSIKNHIEQLPRSEEQPLTTLEQRYLLEMLYRVRMFDVESFGSEFDERDLAELSDLCKNIEQCMPKLSQAITNKYLVHAGPVKLLTSMERSSKDST